MSHLKSALAAVVALSLAGCSGGETGKPVASADAGGWKVTLSTPSGQLTNGANDFTLSVTESSGKTVEVQTPAVKFTMPAMTNMPEMNSEARLDATGQPGVYKGSVELGMKGTWQTIVSFKDSAGLHQASFNVQAQ